MSTTITDDSEVVFEQPGKIAGVVEQEGLTPSQSNEETWLADTEPHRKDRRRAMEFDRPINEELGAALGGMDDNDSVRDDGAPGLHPEQQIRDELRKCGLRHDDNHVGSGVSNPGDLVWWWTNRLRARGTWRHRR